MHFHPISSITIPDRQRKEKPPAHIRELKKSILSKGLLQPIVLTEAGALVVGECRLTAIKEIYTESSVISVDTRQTIWHNNEEVPLDHIPASYIHELSPADLAEAELEENILRAALTMIEEQQAIALIHQLRQSINPNQTIRQTGIEIAERTGASPRSEEARVAKALTISANLSNPRVKAAKSATEAYKLILDEQEAAFKATLLTRGVVSTAHTLIHGDCEVEFPKIDASSVDVVLSDPPYGIDANKQKRTEKHFYDDSPELALSLYTTILRESFRILKPKGTIFLFCDIEHFVILRRLAQQFAFSAWRTPLIWHKGADGFAPWGRLGFIRTYESLLFLSKGEQGLKAPGGSDVIRIDRPSRAERVHAAEKPVELFEYILARAANPTDVVLDPCMGSGPILEAATKLRLRAIGIEKDQSYFNEAAARLTKEPENAEALTNPR